MFGWAFGEWSARVASGRQGDAAQDESRQVFQFLEGMVLMEVTPAGHAGCDH